MQAVWLGDELLLTGKELMPNPGSDGPAVVRLAILDPGFSTWTLLPDSEIIGVDPAIVSGMVVFTEVGSANGGQNSWGRSFPYGSILNPAKRSWTALPEAPKQQTANVSFSNVGVLNVGDSTLVGSDLLNPDTNEWTIIPQLPGVPRNDATVVAEADTMLVWGGATAHNNLAGGYLIRP